MATKYRDEGGAPRTYCKFLGKMVTLDYCKGECTDRDPTFERKREPEDK